MGFPGCHSPSRAEGHLVSCLTFSVALPRLDHRRSSTSVAYCFSFPSLRVVSENDSLADAHDVRKTSNSASLRQAKRWLCRLCGS